ncbi:acetyltransferase [Massilia sp. BSC265]|uniref:acetyltransferase n=1 Tax=Massilia sp. BSC265 TaxID=1549812 RepID=UPI0004E91EE0|nr:acetyltransferase [Massilia sp. BSC265]KFI07589.1 GNAT family acetyltransferase [Massilia sp. BSC265]
MHPIRLSTVSDAAPLADIWRASVRATHDFLSEADFREIEVLVAEHYLPATRVWVALDDAGKARGFLGLSGAHVDALFVDPASRGHGVGRRLLSHAESLAGRLTVDVNEQNLQAVGFYRHMGFEPTGRSPTDDAGRPYPLLHMRQP